MKRGGPGATETAPTPSNPNPSKGRERMTGLTVGPRPPDEPPTDWGVLLAILASWGITLRLVLLICVPIVAVVVIIALIVIYLGAVGVGALLALGGGYGTKWFYTRYRCPRHHPDNGGLTPYTTSVKAQPSPSQGERVNRRLGVFWRLLFVRQTRRTSGTAEIESYGCVQCLACVEGGRGAWGEARRPRGSRYPRGSWPAGRLNATAIVSCRASSRWTRILLRVRSARRSVAASRCLRPRSPRPVGSWPVR
jgi:hypothetical protein